MEKNIAEEISEKVGNMELDCSISDASSSPGVRGLSITVDPSFVRGISITVENIFHQRYCKAGSVTTGAIAPLPQRMRKDPPSLAFLFGGKEVMVVVNHSEPGFHPNFVKLHDHLIVTLTGENVDVLKDLENRDWSVWSVDEAAWWVKRAMCLTAACAIDGDTFFTGPEGVKNVIPDAYVEAFARRFGFCLGKRIMVGRKKALRQRFTL
ncbi:OLC1v1037700C1 [Oldenlandia corymbosa var. corymbosa]|uniref:OLC1v1037700C1 n=1 Tax=Oldenlandia corymbosa var. corymbosa TaxID=529605 RepID=A0AAV1D145_OLDCO|nr:OLC1v1037700C1 [Oldenlandia corymbosa var. corymbosa]